MSWPYARPWVVVGECVVDPSIVARLVNRAGPSGPLSALTPRERDVLSMMAEGRTNTATGQRLFLSEKTVEGNVRRIFDKLGLADSPEDNRRVLAVLAFLRAWARSGRPAERRSRRSSPGCLSRLRPAFRAEPSGPRQGRDLLVPRWCVSDDGRAPPVGWPGRGGLPVAARRKD
jgi:DNA-binding CsgD family transcriptional regulator